MDMKEVGMSELPSINEEFRASLEERQGFFIRFDTFAAIEKALINSFGSSGLTILYLVGMECGKMYYDRISHITTDERMMIELVKKLKRDRNWGEFQIEIDKDKGTCKVSVKYLFEMRTKDIEHCPFVRGYMAGFLSKLLKKEVKFVEEVCKGEVCELYYKIS
jgi:predicted hydrocarbon binding protein